MSLPREQQTKIVTEKRKVTYLEGSQGWEIVKEIVAHAKCAKATVN